MRRRSIIRSTATRSSRRPTRTGPATAAYPSTIQPATLDVAQALDLCTGARTSQRALTSIWLPRWGRRVEHYEVLSVELRGGSRLMAWASRPRDEGWSTTADGKHARQNPRYFPRRNGDRAGIQADRRAIQGGSARDVTASPPDRCGQGGCSGAAIEFFGDVRQQRHERHHVDWGVTGRLATRGPQRVVRGGGQYG
jgi:hypothetical protein